MADEQRLIVDLYPRRPAPDCWILLEPGWVFLYPIQGRRRWQWSVRDGAAGYVFASGSERGYDRAMAAAQLAARLGPEGPVPTRPDPSLPYEAEARTVHVKPYWRRPMSDAPNVPGQRLIADLVRNIVFNPLATYGGLKMACEAHAAEGWALLRIVPHSQFESVAVFERRSYEDAFEAGKRATAAHLLKVAENIRAAHNDGAKHQPGCRAEDGFPCHCVAHNDCSQEAK